MLINESLSRCPGCGFVWQQQQPPQDPQQQKNQRENGVPNPRINLAVSTYSAFLGLGFALACFTLANTNNRLVSLILLTSGCGLVATITGFNLFAQKEGFDPVTRRRLNLVIAIGMIEALGPILLFGAYILLLSNTSGLR
jgi:hypothetical protein